MAEIEYPGDTGQDAQAFAERDGPFSGVVNFLGAAASLALVVGIGVWGYKLVMRDVSGIPVVRAVEGPMRIQPENPGGQPADHQGLAVNAVAATGTAEAPADRLVLAPRPVALAAEDATPAELAGNDDAAAASDTTRGEVDQLVAQLLAEADEEPPHTDHGEMRPKQIAARISQPDPLRSGAPGTDSAAKQDSAADAEPAASATEEPQSQEPQSQDPDPVLLKAPGLKQSLRPQPRPARIVRAVAKAGPAEAPDLDPEGLPAGTRLAQLGAYESSELAQTEWDRLSVRFSDYFRGKSRVIQKASSGGRTFYRLRVAGFEDLSDARRFCSVLVAENADCIPVAIR